MWGSVVISTEPMPAWPPPEGRPIGVERAKFYVNWIKVAVRPLIAEAEQVLLNRYPDGEITTTSLSVAEVSTRVIDPHRGELCVGSVWSRQESGSHAEMAIWIEGSGCLVLRPSLGMTDRQLW